MHDRQLRHASQDRQRQRHAHFALAAQRAVGQLLAQRHCDAERDRRQEREQERLRHFGIGIRQGVTEPVPGVCWRRTVCLTAPGIPAGELLGQL